MFLTKPCKITPVSLNGKTDQKGGRIVQKPVNANPRLRDERIKDANAAITLLEKWPEKNSGFERDSNPGPLRYCCNALPTELSKPGHMVATRVSHVALMP